jgi:hypothetical protein
MQVFHRASRDSETQMYKTERKERITKRNTRDRDLGSVSVEQCSARAQTTHNNQKYNNTKSVGVEVNDNNDDDEKTMF